MDREAWRATMHGVTKSWTRLSHWTELKKQQLKEKLYKISNNFGWRNIFSLSWGIVDLQLFVCLRCTAKWFSDSASQVLPWTKFIPFGRPVGHALNSKQLRILNMQSSMWWCLRGFLDWINYFNKIQEPNPEVKRRSPRLSSNRRPCSLECGCVKQRLGREEVCHEYFACRGQSGV